MRRSFVLALALSACAAAPSPAPAPSSSGGEDAAPRTSTSRFTLARRTPEGAHYAQRMEAWLSDGGRGSPLRFATEVTHEVGSAEDEGTRIETRFGPLEVRDGERIVEPLPADLRGLERVRMVLTVGDDNRVIAGPMIQNEGGPSTAFVDELAELTRHLRVTLPDAPIAVGERWEGDAVHWDTRPTGWVVLELRPVFELEAVVDGSARVRWRGELRVSPFQMMGMTLEGIGEVNGLTSIALDDGWSGRTDLDISVGLRPAGASIPPPFTVSAKYVEEVRRLP